MLPRKGCPAWLQTVSRQLCRQVFISGKPAQKSQVSETGSGRGAAISRQPVSCLCFKDEGEEGRRDKLDLEYGCTVERTNRLETH